MSVSVAPPTFSWATPPASLASRSCSFSRSYSLSVLLDFAADHSQRPSTAFLSPAPSVIVVFSASILTFLHRPRSAELDVFELNAKVLEDRLAAGQGGDVFEHGFAAVAVARRLDGTDLQDALELVEHQGRQRLAFDIFRDDEQRLFLLGDSSSSGIRLRTLVTLSS